MTRILSEVTDLINTQKNQIGISNEILGTNPITLIHTKLQSLKHTIQLVDINSQKHIKSGLMTLKNNFYLENLIKVIGIYHPDNILQKGYGIPRKDGILLTKQELHPNDTIELELSNRVLVLSFIKYKEKWKNSIMNLLRKN